jgi:predicted dithiol-disulfide oxidoreductase (DUF899 family)
VSLPEIVSREEWTRARVELLDHEKRVTRARDALNAERRRLPMVEVTEDHRFEGPDGEATERAKTAGPASAARSWKTMGRPSRAGA